MRVRLFIGAWREPRQAWVEQQEAELFTEQDRALLLEMHILLPGPEDEAPRQESADSLPM